MASPLILIANPGSASRKYALFDGEHERASLHFEWFQGKVICTLYYDDEHHLVQTHQHDLEAAANQVADTFRANNILRTEETISRIGLRVVAPGGYFLEDRLVDDDFVAKLEAAKSLAPIHIGATLEELHVLRKQFQDTPIVGVSDSAFHKTKPDYAWNYGISLEDADRFEIKRFGYHGISVASVVNQLTATEKLLPKMVICHLGSGASVTALQDGKSIDNTMGYSPLEGIIMSTRSGSIDPTAVHALKEAYHLDDQAIEDYLNNHSGLLGLGGSSDTRELLAREENGDNLARLALATFVYSVQKGIGQMTAALGGIDALVFTGTVGERSWPIRGRVVKNLSYLGIAIDGQTNNSVDMVAEITDIHTPGSKPTFVIPANESAEIARRTNNS